MSIAPQPAYPTWPPAYPPPPPVRRRRWLPLLVVAGISAVAAGAITTLITIQATNPGPTTPTAIPQTVTVMAGPSQTPTPTALPAEADRQTCRAWHTVSPLVTAGAVAQGVIPQGMTITDPAVQANPAWAAGVTKASQLYEQAADTLAAQTAARTSTMLAQITDTTVSALHTLSIAYKTYDPANGNSMKVFQANQQAMDVLCP